MTTIVTEKRPHSECLSVQLLNCVIYLQLCTVFCVVCINEKSDDCFCHGSTSLLCPLPMLYVFVCLFVIMLSPY